MKKARDCHTLLKTFRTNFATLQNPTHNKMDPSERYSFNPVLRWNPQVEDYFIKAYGAQHFSRISKALTHPSCYSCIRVNTLKSTSDAVIEKLLTIMQDSGFKKAADCVDSHKTDATVDSDIAQKLEHSVKESNVNQNSDACGKVVLGQNEDIARAMKESLQDRTISKCLVPGLEYVVFVKGSGPHTIDYGYAPGKPPKEVIVSRKCAEAVLRGAQIYVPGVMACSAHVEKGDVVAVSVAIEQPGVDGKWGLGITRGTIMHGLETGKKLIYPYYSERGGLYIGQGTTMMSRAGTFRVTEGIAVDMNNRIFKLPSFYDVLEGEIFLQNLPSIVTAHALDPQKGERILDMCAAPGGKTTAIAILMRDEGEVVAVDRSHNKVMDIQKLAAEMGLNCITTYKLDALKAVCRRNESNDISTKYCSKDNVCESIQGSDDTRLHEERVSSTATEGLTAVMTCTENVSNEKGNERTYISKADIRRNKQKMRNGPGRNQSLGGRVENSKGFFPSSFDRVLLDAPCSALGLRPRLFAGEETIVSLRNHGKYQRRMFDQACSISSP
ncbi:hypothetical protein Patl1_01425 [Pistacia atlantica]|uniref:Uncharacterized protein n=1 Tax=Pistacia atlantica TaxID=434234 RepID=A0ACC1C9B7_9ROSI|nr:hypothetical protein Patl1_01425 [Pistacia atlantica]